MSISSSGRCRVVHLFLQNLEGGIREAYNAIEVLVDDPSLIWVTVRMGMVGCCGGSAAVCCGSRRRLAIVLCAVFICRVAVMPVETAKLLGCCCRCAVTVYWWSQWFVGAATVEAG
jgi:hypothetical protein